MQIHRRGVGFFGTGFFVAPGVVLTSAHVLRDIAREGEPEVHWGGERWIATDQVLVPASTDGGDFYPFPDLATLRLLDPPTGHPCARLAADDPPDGSTVAVAGFSRVTPTPGTHPDSLRLTVAGRADRFLRVKDDQVVAGFSGSPVADPSSGDVLGVVKASRDRSGDAGGWITPISAVRATLAPDLVAANLDHHRHAVPLPLPSDLVQLLSAQSAAADRMPDSELTREMPLPDLYVQQPVKPSSDTSELPTSPEPDGGLPATRTPPPPADRSAADVLRGQRHLVVVGEPGGGKSTLLRHLTHLAALWWLEAGEAGTIDPTTSPIGPGVPVRVRAVDLMGLSLPDAMAHNGYGPFVAAHLDGRPSPSLFTEPPLPEVPWLVLIDGLDEITDGPTRANIIRGLAARMDDPDGKYRLVVTTRPLGDEQLAPLTASAGGEYSLRTFDDQQLETFARRWFGTHGPATAGAGADADAYLAAVGAAQLRSVVALPLLATIVATVFRSAGGGSLQRSRAALYTSFVEHLDGRRRNETHAEMVGQMGPFGAGSATALWERRAAVLALTARGHLADAGRPVLDIAVAAAERPDSIPSTTWRAAVRSLLAGSGLFVAEAADLRFLHRSFAEFLTAQLDARGLALDRQAVQPWVARVLSGDGANVAGFVLDMWAQREGADVDSLVRDLATRREPRAPRIAAVLMRWGAPITAPTGDAVVAAFTRLVRLPRDPEHEGSVSWLGGLLDRPSARAALRATAQDTYLEFSLRVSAAETLARAGGAVRDEAAALLTALAGTVTADVFDRLAVTEALARIGFGDRSLELLLRITEDDDPTSRVLAARKLIEIGRADVGLPILLQVADDDTGARMLGRVWAVQGLAEAGRRDEGIARLRALAADPRCIAYDRYLVADELDELGEHDQARELLREIVRGPPGSGSIEAARALYRFGNDAEARDALLGLVGAAGINQYRLAVAVDDVDENVAADMRRSIVLDPSRFAFERVHAARHLITRGQQRWGTAMIRRFAEAADPELQITAAAALVELGDLRRGLRVLRRIASGRHRTILGVSVAREQIAAARALVRTGHLDEGLTALRAITVLPEVRLSAAGALVDVGAVDEGMQIMRGTLEDPQADPADRLFAARLLWERGDRKRAGEFVLNQATDESGTRVGRYLAACALPDVGQRALAVELVENMIVDLEMNEAERYGAGVWLLRRDPDRGRAVLEELAVRAESEEVREAATRTLADR